METTNKKTIIRLMPPFPMIESLLPGTPLLCFPSLPSDSPKRVRLRCLPNLLGLTVNHRLLGRLPSDVNPLGVVAPQLFT